MELMGEGPTAGTIRAVDRQLPNQAPPRERLEDAMRRELTDLLKSITSVESLRQRAERLAAALQAMGETAPEVPWRVVKHRPPRASKRCTRCGREADPIAFTDGICRSTAGCDARRALREREPAGARG